MITTVNIQGKQYAYRFGPRAMMGFEAMSGKTFGEFRQQSISDSQMLHYACLIAGAARDRSDLDLSFSEYLDACEDDPQLAARLSAALSSQTRGDGADEPEEGKKKD